METYKELTVWQKSIDLVLDVYSVTESLPDSEKFGLTSQLRRCAVSIPSNIAEGYSKKSNPEFIRFLRISYGSSAELETQLYIAKKLTFVSEEDFAKVNSQLTEIRKMLNKLMSSLN